MVVIVFFNLGFFCKVLTIIFTAIAYGLYKYLLKESNKIMPIPVKNHNAHRVQRIVPVAA